VDDDELGAVLGDVAQQLLQLRPVGRAGALAGVNELGDDTGAELRRQISEDPRSSGFPPGHAPMTSFLGVPIRIHDAVTSCDRHVVVHRAAEPGLVVAAGWSRRRAGACGLPADPGGRDPLGICSATTTTAATSPKPSREGARGAREPIG
jgi:hypothetical protein